MDNQNLNEYAAALGLFDGVHIGHQRVLKTACEYNKCGFIPACFSFRTGSMKQKHNSDIQYIYPEDQKIKYIKECGIEHIVSVDFEAVRDMSAEEFIDKMLIEKMHCKAIICGEDFRFGKDARGDVELLDACCKADNIKLQVVPSVDLDGKRVSSADIRAALKAGNLNSAKALLGRNFEICARVFSDRGNGTKLGFPTINQEITAPLKHGVYSSSVIICDKIYKGITNVGVRPTLMENGEVVAETHILNFDGELYGQYVEVVLKEFMRSEIKFASVEELKKQIEHDVEYVSHS